MENLDLIYQRIVESLKLLALPYNKQKQCFEEFVDVPFEVLDTYDNMIVQLPKLIEAGRLSNVVIASLLRLYIIIDFTARNPRLKDLEEDQFSDDPEWNKIRKLAQETLQIMGEQIENPNPKYI